MVTQGEGGELSVVKGGGLAVMDPLKFFEQTAVALYRGRVCGVRNEGEAYALAMACYFEGQHPFQINRQYHLMDGKLAMRADWMLSQFRVLGGDHEWIETGDDGKRATLRLWVVKGDGKPKDITFTIDDAKKQKLLRADSGWDKDPGSMLRARCISKGVRMLRPEIVAGCYTPEEIGSSEESLSSAVTRTPEEIAARRAEIEASSGAEVAGDTSVVIDVVAEPVTATASVTAAASPAETKVEQPPFDAGASAVKPQPQPQVATDKKPDINAVLLEIAHLIPRVGRTVAEVEAALAKKNPAIKSLNDLPYDEAVLMLSRFRAAAEKVEAAKKS